MHRRIGYVCGPLTDLPADRQESVKLFYARIGDLFQRVTDRRAFVPHEHFDPIRHAQFTPPQVDAVERRQVGECTSLLVAVGIFVPAWGIILGSWGGGIEVEIARASHVPVVLLWPKLKKPSRLLEGNQAVWNYGRVVSYQDEDHALEVLAPVIKEILGVR